MDVKFDICKFSDTGNLKMMMPIYENEIFNVILAFRQQRTMGTKENFQNAPMDLKFGMSNVFDTGNLKMMMPIYENEIFNVILAFRQQRTKKLMKIFKIVRLS